EGEGEGEGEGDLAEALRNAFAQADANGDGRISRAESRLLFPELTDAQFDALDTNGDGFLSRAELDLDTPGGCAGPNPTEGFFLVGILLYLVALCESLMRMPGRIMSHFLGTSEPEEEPID
ncbi:MAG: hypothetical protein Q8N51_06820, partial [Gammaproteobacteria bacterium]|nr:hypothetical protein [Gammaproteobacteria bacterium]